MIKRVLFWVILVAVAAGGYFWWRHSRGSTADSAIVYRTAAVQRGDVTQTVAASGSLSAITTVEIGSQVSGQISKLHVDFNSVVKAGQLVAEIEPSTYESRVLQAEADLSSARSSLELKELNARRSADLLKKNLLSQADYDQSQTELRQQQSTVLVKEAALKAARVDLDRTKIRSPIDGVVISRDVNLGQTVQASFSAPKLFVVAEDLRKMQITASVSEADIGGVEPEQNVTFTVDAFPGRTFIGKVREVRNNPTTTQNVVNYSTIIDVTNHDLKLRPGMTANVTITIAKRAGVLRVPNAAVRFRPPEGAVVVNAAGEKKAAAPAGEGPNLDQMPPEMRERILANFDKNKDGELDADERKAMREAFQARMAAGGGGGPGGPGGGGGGGMIIRGGPGGGMGGGPGGPGGGQRPRPQNSNVPQTRTVYLVSGKPDATGRATGTLTATAVRTGLSDNSFTEILSGVDQGAVVATGTSITAPAPAAGGTATNPFVPRPPAPKMRGGG